MNNKIEKSLLHGKMLRSEKLFCRCCVQGHGQNFFCEVMDDLQGTQINRAFDKRRWKKEVDDQLEEYYKLKL